MKSDARFYVGVDSGGTKCHVLIVSQGLSEIFSKSYKGAHYSVSGAKKFSSYISELILRSLSYSKLDPADCKAVCLGAAGAREESDRNEIRKGLVKLLGTKVVVTTDAMTALAGSFDSGDGIILISGTGSVLYGKSGNKIYRVGGWGRIIGDEGSGYWLGKKALNMITKEFDETKSKKRLGKLSRAIKQQHGIDRDNLNSKVFKENFPLQSLAPTVIAAAQNGCKLSKSIIDEAVVELKNHVETFIRISKRRKPIHLAFIGSVIESDNILSSKLKRILEQNKLITVVRRKHSPAFGAARIAAGKFKIAGIT